MSTLRPRSLASLATQPPLAPDPTTRTSYGIVAPTVLQKLYASDNEYSWAAVWTCSDETAEATVRVAVLRGGGAGSMRPDAGALAGVALPMARGPHRTLHGATHLVSHRHRRPARRTRL